MIAKNHPSLKAPKKDKNLEKRIDTFATQLISNAPTADDLLQLETLNGRLQAIDQKDQARSSSDSSIIAKVHEVTLELRRVLTSNRELVERITSNAKKVKRAFVHEEQGKPTPPTNGQVERLPIQPRALVIEERFSLLKDLPKDLQELVILQGSICDMGRISKVASALNKAVTSVLTQLARKISERLQESAEPLFMPLKNVVNTCQQKRREPSAAEIRSIFEDIFQKGQLPTSMRLTDIKSFLLYAAKSASSYHMDLVSYLKLLQLFCGKPHQTTDLENFNDRLTQAAAACKLTLDAYLQFLRGLNEGTMDFILLKEELQNDFFAAKIAVILNPDSLHDASEALQNHAELQQLASRSCSR